MCHDPDLVSIEGADDVGDESTLPVLIGVEVFATQPLYRDRRVAYRVSKVEMASTPTR